MKIIRLLKGIIYGPVTLEDENEIYHTHFEASEGDKE